MIHVGWVKPAKFHGGPAEAAGFRKSTSISEQRRIAGAGPPEKGRFLVPPYRCNKQSSIGACITRKNSGILPPVQASETPDKKWGMGEW
jgi:hypothetical protein